MKYGFLGLLFCLVGLSPVLSQRAGDKKAGRRETGFRLYTIEQALSDRAQLHTLSFSGLAFITGNFGADCFFPPGKVADFFGFQYMRDNDRNGMGHNSEFLTRIALYMIQLLSPAQRNQLISLAREQAPLYDSFAYQRMILVRAFRNNMEGIRPWGSVGLSRDSVVKFVGRLYSIDAALSLRRADVYGNIVRNFTEDQKRSLAGLRFDSSASWPVVKEVFDKKALSHRAHVGLMTCASELFSWYKGGVVADVYFCPERHGAYFGGFYMKDFPAMGHPDYFISTSLTGELGKDFLTVLDSSQRSIMEGLVDLQRPYLVEMVRLRTFICESLRKNMDGPIKESKAVEEAIIRYGEQDGAISFLYASAFASLYPTLSKDQRKTIWEIRNQPVLPTGGYLYSDPISTPTLPSIDFLFGLH